MFSAELGLEVLHFLLVAGLLGVLTYLAHKHNLGRERGWLWIAAGLSILFVQAGLEVVDGFVGLQTVPGMSGYANVLGGLLLPIAGFGALGYGLVRWFLVPARLQGAHQQLEGTNKQLEQRIQERTQDLNTAYDRLNQIVADTPAVIYTCAPEPPYTITWLCQNTRHVLGRQASEILAASDTWLEEIHPQDQGTVKEALERLTRDEEPRTVEYEYRIETGGSTRWLHETARLRGQSPGEVREIVATAFDVTDRVRAEQALAESETRLQQVTENLEATAWLATVAEDPSDSDILYLSPGASDMFGMPEQLIRNDPLVFLDRVLEEDIGAVLDAMIPEGPEDLAFDVTYRIRLNDGSIRYLNSRGVPIYDEDGIPYRIAGLTQDVTQLRETERRLKRAQELADVGDWVYNLVTGEQIWSKQIFTMLGRDPEQGPAPFEWIRERVHPDDVDAIDRVFANVELGIPGPHEVEYRFERDDGRTRKLHTRVVAEFDEDEEPTRVFGTNQDITELREAEEDVYESERQFRQITESLEVDVWLADWTKDEGPGEVLYATSTFEEIHEIPRERLFEDPMAWLEPVHPDDVDRVEVAMEAMDPGDPRFDLQYRLRMENGRIKHVRSRIFPVMRDGEPIRMVGISEDVTDEVQAEREQERLRKHLETVVENQDLVVFSVDDEGYFTLSEGKALEALGLEPGEAVGQHTSDLYDKETLQYLRKALDGEPQEYVQQVGDAWMDVSLVPRFEDDHLVAVDGVALDVTEVIQLREEEKLKARMLDQVGQAVIATDAHGEVTYWNTHAEAMYGYTADEALGSNIMDLTVPDTDEGKQVAAEVMARLGQGEVWSGEFQAQHKDGSRFPALVTDAPLVDEDDDLAGVIGVSQDITELKETQERLRETSRRLRARGQELRELAQATAHGFRTPIWDTTRYLDLLAREAADTLSQEAQEYLQTALEGAHRLRDLVASLQDYLDASTRPPSQGPANAGEALDNALTTLADRIDEDGPHVTIQSPAPDLAIDPPSLEEILLHVLENALKFHEEDPLRIEVAFERADEMWIVSIQDNGPGIDPEYQDRIFRPFRTLHRQAEGAGPGLGLALARNVVSAHGGRMWVRSTPGEGTTVYMTLPEAGSARAAAEGDQDKDVSGLAFGGAELYEEEGTLFD